ncbi:Fc receptor-like protein 5 [Tenrec ecaudatus]|uniref:Fc receptor-like protein 5 n=1 Tax=Tenrec ecaudatus TaxID=94439 RepID=UPI003F5965BC
MLWWPLLPPPQPLLLLLLLLLLDQLILQAPTSIFEGDRVTLRCLSKKEEDFDKMTYYKDGREVQSTVRNSNFIIPKAVSHNNGIYSCRTLIEDHAFPLERSSNDVRIIVQELFPPPELTARPSKPIEGSPVALRCETRLPSQRSYIQLRFQFLKDNYTLDAGWRTSAKLQIPTMRAEHSGSYACKARAATSDIWRSSQTIQIHVQIPVSHLLFTLRLPRAQAEVGDVVELRCEARRGSPPIWYQFYHEDVFLGGSSAPSGGGASFNLSLTEEHSGKYSCAATNGLRTLHSDTVSLNVTVPVSRPVLTLRTPRAHAVVGDVMELHCEAQKGSSPILYQLYRENDFLGDKLVLSGRGASFNLSLTEEHSGNYSCEASNSLGSQLSQVVIVNVKVPVSRPVLTLKTPGPQAVMGDMAEFHCQAWTGSPPILYQFYHENAPLGSSSFSFGGGVFFNLSLTREHSGNYSCEADNGLGPRRSELVTLFIKGLKEGRSGTVVTGITGGLLGMMGLAAVALLLYYVLLKKAVNFKGSDVVYSEVQSIQKEKRHAVASPSGLLKDKVSLPTGGPSSTPAIFLPSPMLSFPQDSSVIYTQVKVASNPRSQPQLLASLAPHR